MPETYWTKKRRGIAGLTGRTTRIPPKEYWPGVGELEVDSGRNHSRNTTNAKRTPDSCSIEFEFHADNNNVDRSTTTTPTECKNTYDTNKRDGNDSKSGEADLRTDLQRTMTSPFTVDLDASAKEGSGEESTRKWNHRKTDDGEQQQQLHEPQELLRSTHQTLRQWQLLHMRRRSPKRRLVTKVEDNNCAADLDDDKERNRSAENPQSKQYQNQQNQHHHQEEQHPRQTQQLAPAISAAAAAPAISAAAAVVVTSAPSPRRQTRRPKRMLASLFPYNTVGHEPPDIDVGDGRTRRRGKQQVQYQPTYPSQPRRHKRMLARLAAFNGFGIKEVVDLDLDAPGRRTRRGRKEQRQPPPVPLSQPCQPHRPKRKPAGRASVHKKESAVTDKYSNAAPSTKAPRKRGRPAKTTTKKQPPHACRGKNTKRVLAGHEELDSEIAPPKLLFPGRRKRRKRSPLGNETLQNPK